MYKINEYGNTDKCKVIYWDEEYVTVDSKTNGRYDTHIQSLIGEPLNHSCCVIYHPGYDAYLPVYAKQVILDANFQSFRVSEAKYNYSNGVWILDCIDEELDKANIKLFARNVFPHKDNKWHGIQSKFFILNEKIGQYDGTVDEIPGLENASNIGDKLRKLLYYFEVNENEISECIQEILMNGISNENLKKNARFNDNGFAFKARQNMS